LSSTVIGFDSMTPSARPARADSTSHVDAAMRHSTVTWRTGPMCSRLSGAVPNTACSASRGRVTAAARSV